MTIEVDILMSGVPVVQKAAAHFNNLADALVKNAGGFDKLSKSEQRAVQDLRKMGASAAVAATGFEGVAVSLGKAEKALKGMAAIKSPFTKMDADVNRLRKDVVAVNKELQDTNALSSGKLNNSMYMGMTRNIKAAVVLQSQLNAEIEKQAFLVAKLATLEKSRNSAVAGGASNLNTAKAQTAVLEKKVATAEDPLNLESQSAAVEKMRSRLAALNTVGLPTDKVRKLKMEINALNTALKKTGTSQKSGIANISKQLSGLETQLGKSGKATVDWSKSMKFAVGGVARSFGAMTYSYSLLAPLLAGMAVGGSIKKIYELGTAFEYTTKYVDTLRESVEGIDLASLRGELLGLEGLRRGPEELAQGMKEFAKAGVEASESIGQIEEMSKFAAVAEMELGEAVKLVIGQSNAFDTTFVESSNMIAAAALSSATDIQEMGNALSYTTELATISGVKFDEVATALALMANQGIRGSKAGTAVRTSIIKMQAPSEKLKKNLDALGISWSAFTEGGQVKDLRTMFSELKRVTEDLVPREQVAIFKELFGLRAAKGGATLIRNMGDEYDKLNAKIRDSVNGVTFLSSTYDELSETVRAKMEVLGASVERVFIKAFDSAPVQQMFEDLEKAVSSGSFEASLKSIIGGINTLGSALTGLLKLGSSIPLEVSEMGFIGYMLFGKNPAGLTIAGVSLLEKEIHKVQQSFSSQVAEPWIASMFGVDELSEQVTKDSSIVEKFTNQLEHFKMAYVGMFGSESEKAAVKKWSEDFFGKKETAGELSLPDIDIDTSTLSSLREKLGIALGEGNREMVEDLREGIIKLETSLRAETEKQLEIDFNLGVFSPKIKEDFANWRAAVEAVEGAISEVDKEIETADFSVWEKQLSGVEEKVMAFKDEQLSLEFPVVVNDEQLEQLRQKLNEGLIAKGLRNIKEATEELTLGGLIKDLKESDSVADKVKGQFQELRAKALEFAEANGQTFKNRQGVQEFTTAGKAYFKALIESSGLFTKAIKESQEQVRSLNQEIQGLEFGFIADISEVKGKLVSSDDRAEYKYQEDLKQIEMLKAAAYEAGNSGIEGRERQLELLQQAYNLTKSLDTAASTAGLKAEMEWAKAEMEKYSDSTAGLKEMAERDYEAAKLAFEQAESAGIGDEGKIQQQIQDMQTLQEAILVVKEEERNLAEDQTRRLEDQQEAFQQYVSGASDSFSKPQESARELGKIIDINTGKVVDWANASVEQINRVKEAQEALNAAAAASAARAAVNAPEPFKAGAVNSNAAAVTTGTTTGGNTTTGGTKGSNVDNVIYNFHQKVSRSDVENITRNQQLLKARL